MTHHAWVFLSRLNTHSLDLKAIRHMLQLQWVFFNCLNTHSLGLILIRSIPQHAWHVAHCLITHPLCFKLVRNKKCTSTQQKFFVVHLPDDIPKYIFKQVSHSIHTLRVWQGSNFMVHFHNPYPQAYRHDLSFPPYAQPLK